MCAAHSVPVNRKPLDNLPCITSRMLTVVRSKTEKYPDGYAGDVEERFPLASRQHRTIRTHVRWTCHTCSTLFKDKEKTCDKCGHSRCNECTRQPPKNPKPELDEAAIRSVEERLKNIHVSPQAVGARPDDERSGSLHLST